jgi:hypothetical protein
MKYNNLSMIFGILFSVGLGILAYLSFILALVLSFLGIDWFVVMMFVFAALALASLVGAFFARKKVLVTIVINAISMAAILFVVIYLLAAGVLAESVQMLSVFIGMFVLGATQLVFGILAKRKQSKAAISATELG